MAATILDGKAIAGQIRDEVRLQVDRFIQEGGPAPCLAAVLVGDDPASQVYIRNKERACQRAGMQSRLQRLDADTSQDQLEDMISQLNRDAAVHGILVQLPLPEHVSEAQIKDAIDPTKDVDAFHPENVGRLDVGRPRFLPCTPQGVQQLLHRSGIEVAGKHVVIVGRSDIVGKPLAMMLMQRDSPCGPAAANATVTVCHSHTANLPALTRQADVLVAAIGRAGFITADMVKPGAVVVDIGINRSDEGLVGDVDFPAVSEVAGYITPVPGGVGPLTVAMLLVNTLTAARIQREAFQSGGR